MLPFYRVTFLRYRYDYILPLFANSLFKYDLCYTRFFIEQDSFKYLNLNITSDKTTTPKKTHNLCVANDEYLKVILSQIHVKNTSELTK